MNTEDSTGYFSDTLKYDKATIVFEHGVLKVIENKDTLLYDQSCWVLKNVIIKFQENKFLMSGERFTSVVSDIDFLGWNLFTKKQYSYLATESKSNMKKFLGFYWSRDKKKLSNKTSKFIRYYINIPIIFYLKEECTFDLIKEEG